MNQLFFYCYNLLRVARCSPTEERCDAIDKEIRLRIDSPSEVVEVHEVEVV